jgi:hypothetical protein
LLVQIKHGFSAQEVTFEFTTAPDRFRFDAPPSSIGIAMSANYLGAFRGGVS